MVFHHILEDRKITRSEAIVPKPDFSTNMERVIMVTLPSEKSIEMNKDLSVVFRNNIQQGKT